MSIVQTQTTSFKAELYQGVHNLLTDTLKIALFTANADLNEATTVYSTTNEIVGTGYTAGGKVITGVTVNTSGYTAYVNFDNVVWNPAAFTARCALIYNSSKGNKSIAVLDFGSDKTCSGTFTVQLPANTATTALIRSTI
jgi:hypothetical protein